MSKENASVANQDEKNLMRMFIPLLKMFTAKESIRIASEGIEFFGGIGYMENSHIPVILRDA